MDAAMSEEDRQRFTALIYLSNGTEPVVYSRVRGGTLYTVDTGKKITAIGAHVLMPNHFHLLVKETSKNGITEFMRRLTTAYSMYFNKRHERVGPLFQGTFKAEHLDTDEYLKYMFAYIHLNPVTLVEAKWKEEGIKNPKRAKEYLSEYKHSSFLDYSGNSRKENVTLSKNEFPEYFSEANDFEKFIQDWLLYKVEPRTK